MRHPLLDVRAWHRWKKRMYYLGNDREFRLKVGVGFNALFDRQPEPNKAYSLMFFTGLRDAHRAKIYTDDILAAPNGDRWRVYFDGGAFLIRSSDRRDAAMLRYVNPQKSGWLVVGNRWEGCG